MLWTDSSWFGGKADKHEWMEDVKEDVGARDAPHLKTESKQNRIKER